MIRLWLAHVLLVFCAQVTIGQDDTRIVFRGVNVVPMDTERVLFQQTVLIEDGRITALGSGGAVSVPDGVRVIEARGKFLMPGLQDLHVHMVDEGDLTVYLANGVTTVRNLMGTPWHIEVRDRILAGELLGPRMFTSGPFVNQPQVRTPDEVREAVARQVAAGYDCVKIHGDLQLDAYAALIEAGAEAGIPIVGHIPRNLRAEDVLALEGQADISHGEEYLYTFFDRQDVQADPESTARIAALTFEAGIAVVPNLIAYYLIARQVDDLSRELAVPEMTWVSPLTRLTWSPAYNKYARDFDATDAPVLRRRFAFLQRFTKALQDAGVTLLLGSDALNPTAIPGLSAHQELAWLVASGLTPYQALRAGTSAAGEFQYGPQGPGTIAVGRPADLVLLSANPLEDVAYARRIEGVCIGGRWINKGELDVRMKKLQESYEREKAFMQLVDVRDFSRAETFYHARKFADPEAEVFREAGIASLVSTFGYLRDGDKAMRAAELYTAEFPDSWRAWTRLAEAQELAQLYDHAEESRARADELR
jgi:hypothetical protein